MARSTGDGRAREAPLDEAGVLRAREESLSPEVASEVAETFKVLATPTRVRLIRALAAGELCVGDLAQVVGLSVSATSHQLQELRRARIVGQRAEGKRVYYRLIDPFVSELVASCLGRLDPA